MHFKLEGALILINENTTTNIGELNDVTAGTFQLEKVTLDNLQAGVATALANEVHAVTLDLVNGTNLIFNANIKSDTVTKSNGVGKL